jgi:hypothetical protein
VAEVPTLLCVVSSRGALEGHASEVFSIASDEDRAQVVCKKDVRKKLAELVGSFNSLGD